MGIIHTHCLLLLTGYYWDIYIYIYIQWTLQLILIYKGPTDQLKMWTFHSGNLFIVVKVCVEPATIFALADICWIEHQCACDSPEQHSSGFEFSVFPFLRPKLEIPVCLTILGMAGWVKDGFLLFLRALVWREKETASSKCWT